MTPLLEGCPSKAKEAPPHRIRLTPLDTNRVFFWKTSSLCIHACFNVICNNHCLLMRYHFEGNDNIMIMLECGDKHYVVPGWSVELEHVLSPYLGWSREKYTCIVTIDLVIKKSEEFLNKLGFFYESCTSQYKSFFADILVLTSVHFALSVFWCYQTQTLSSLFWYFNWNIWQKLSTIHFFYNQIFVHLIVVVW